MVCCAGTLRPSVLHRISVFCAVVVCIGLYRLYLSECLRASKLTIAHKRKREGEGEGKRERKREREREREREPESLAYLVSYLVPVPVWWLSWHTLSNRISLTIVIVWLTTSTVAVLGPILG